MIGIEIKTYICIRLCFGIPVIHGQVANICVAFSKLRKL